jgi:platelet-activating factor acetylhydrolase IB subunit alpha
VDFVRGGDFILSCSRDKTLKLWEIATGYCKRTYLGHEEYVRKFDISADGKTFVSCSDDQSVIMWNFDK